MDTRHLSFFILKVIFQKYFYKNLKNTFKKIKQSLDLKDGIWSFTEKKEGIIRECDILFTKIDKKRASEEVARLKENKI